FLRDVAQFEVNEPFSAGVWIKTNKGGGNQSIMGISGELTKDAWRGWDLFLDEKNRPSLRLIGFWPHNCLQVTANVSIPLGEWRHVLFTYDGSGRANGTQLFVNGEKTKSFTVYDNLYRTIIHSWEVQEGWTQKPVMVGRSGRFYTGDNGVFSGSIDHIQFFNQYLTTREVASLIRRDTGIALSAYNFANEDYIDHHMHRSYPDGQELIQQLRELTRKKLELLADVPEIM
ncbi:uncharacterized protein METZ01_LOCUS513355, partial [marine metagenome]